MNLTYPNIKIGYKPYLRLLMFVLVFLWLFLSPTSAQYISIDNQQGYWSDSLSWKFGNIPGTSVSGTNILVYGELTANQCLDFNNLKLGVFDTLILHGNLDLKNNALLYIDSGAVFIVLGDYESKNKVQVVNYGTLVVAGKFRMLGADNQGSFENIGEVFLFDPDPEIKQGDEYAGLYCSIDSVRDTICGYGNKTDYQLHHTYPYFGSLPFDTGTISTEGNPCYRLEIEPTDTEFCENRTIQLSEDVIGVSNESSLNWNFGDGAIPATAIGIGPHKIYYSTPGAKLVQLHNTEASDSVLLMLNVHPKPDKPLFYINHVIDSMDMAFDTVCRNSTTTLKVSGNPANDFYWHIPDFGIDTIASDSLVISWDEVEKSYPISVKEVSPFGCDSDISEAVIRVDACIIENIIVNQTNICISDTLEVFLNTNNSKESGMYIWNFGQGAIPTSDNTIGPHKVLYQNAGLKTIYLTHLERPELMKSVEVMVYDLAEKLNFIIDNRADTNTISDLGQACLNEPSNISVNGSSDLSYHWQIPQLLMDTIAGKDLEVNWNVQLGIHDIIVEQFTGATCTTVSSRAGIRIIDCTQESMVLSKTEVCAGESLIVALISNRIAADSSYSWNFGKNAIPETSMGFGPFEIYYTSAGQKEILLKRLHTPDTVLSGSVFVEAGPPVRILEFYRTADNSFLEYPYESCSEESIRVEYPGDTNSTYYWVIESLDIDTTGDDDPLTVSIGDQEVLHQISVRETDSQGCMGETVSEEIQVINCKTEEPVIEEPVESILQDKYAFSPNQDGINERWVVNEILDYPMAKLTVYDRFGRIIFLSDGNYQNNWNGTYNGGLLPVDSYHFVIDLSMYDKKPVRGIVTILHNK